MSGEKKSKPNFSNVQSGGSSTAPPAPAPSAPSTAGDAPLERTYEVAKGDNLSKIAKKFYGNGNKWKRIFEANRDALENPDIIYPGQILKIPEE